MVDAGEYVSLVCNASGYPVPNITWKMDGVVIGVGRTFNITRARKDDSSCYTCTADNGIGHSKNASVCLKVQCKFGIKCWSLVNAVPRRVLTLSTISVLRFLTVNCNKNETICTTSSKKC